MPKIARRNVKTSQESCYSAGTAILQWWPETIRTKRLVVFIVGEDSTRGIHRSQFENAVEWINALQQSSDKRTHFGRHSRADIFGLIPFLGWFAHYDRRVEQP